MISEVSAVGPRQQRFELAQAALGTPVLGQLDRRAGQLAVLLQLGLEQLEQGEGVGGSTGKAGQHLAIATEATLCRALPFITVWPSVTWPSPATATWPLRRTEMMVVAWNVLGF